MCVTAVPVEVLMSQTVAEIRDTKIAGNVCSWSSRSNVVASSVDSHLHVDNSTREKHVGTNNEKFRTTEHGAGENHYCSILINVRGINQPLRILVDTGKNFMC